MSTCTPQFRGGIMHGKAHKIYKGDEGNNEGMLLIIDVDVCLDLDQLSHDILCFLWLFS